MNDEALQLERIADALWAIVDHLCCSSPDEPELKQMEKAYTAASPDMQREALGALTRTATVATVNSMATLENDLAPIYNEPEKPPVKKDDVIAALNKAGRKHGIDAAKRVLASFGAKLDDVDPAKYRELVDVLGAL